MNVIIELFQLANSLSPLAVIGLLVTVVLMLVKSQRKVEKIEGNDLYHIEASLREISETLQRLEVALTYIKARLNGKTD